MGHAMTPTAPVLPMDSFVQSIVDGVPKAPTSSEGVSAWLVSAGPNLVHATLPSGSVILTCVGHVVPAVIRLKLPPQATGSGAETIILA